MNKKISSALISVFYKDGLEPVVRQLKEGGATIYTTGGTQKFIEGLGIEVVPVESLTSYPSILGGRVKTLHPSVFGGILGRRENETDVQEMQQYHIPVIDLVIVDLYPFEQTLAQAHSPSFDGGEEEVEKAVIEKIDIGGPSMIRAAAKNFKDVAVIASKEDYGPLVQLLKNSEGSISLEQRKAFAAKAFEVVAHYDIAISNYFNSAKLLTETGTDQQTPLRYGENPHQKAVFIGNLNNYFEQLHGKELSYNNLVDVDAAIQLISEFNSAPWPIPDPSRWEGPPAAQPSPVKETNINTASPQSGAGAQVTPPPGEPEGTGLVQRGEAPPPEGLGEAVWAVFAIIKHTNVCGIAGRPSVLAAWKEALAGDPESAFGGVLVCNREIDEETAKEINDIFFEVLIAPSFSKEALTVLQGRKNRVLLQLAKNECVPESQSKTLLAGTLKQEADEGNYLKWEEAGGRETTGTEKEDLVFANIICKHLKSNAIALVKNRQLVGKGCGQTSRIDALRQALEKAKQFHFDLSGAVMASDAFFPFNDCVKLGHEAGIAAFIQPGGSIRDKDSIDYCRQNKLAMVITGMRHFRH